MARSQTRISRARLNSFASLRKKGHRSSVCRSFFYCNIFVRQKTTRISTWPRKCRGNQHRHWQKVARETGAIIIPSLLRNAALAFITTPPQSLRDGKLLGKYRKMHIPDDPLYHEKFISCPATLGLRLGQHRRARWRLVCWDQWYPEVARLTALNGGDIIFIRQQLVGTRQEAVRPTQHAAWETIQCSHGIANGCYVGPEPVGHEAPAGGDGIEFWGQSFVCGPDGEILAKGSSTGKRL